MAPAVSPHDVPHRAHESLVGSQRDTALFLGSTTELRGLHPSGTLVKVLVRRLRLRDIAEWESRGWKSKPNLGAAAREHADLRRILARAGADVVEADAPGQANPDAIYVCDPALITSAGGLMLRPGKEVRRSEVDQLEKDFRRIGFPIVGRIEPPACVEGGDLMWLDSATLLVGRSYRTNDAGVRALIHLLKGVQVLPFDVPHWQGPTKVLHLTSMISRLDRDLVVACVPLLPVGLVQLLVRRGIQIVESPDSEWESLGPNVLALGHRRALALQGNPVTRDRMMEAGVQVLTYSGEEISRKGEGGPTCLTLGLSRNVEQEPRDDQDNLAASLGPVAVGRI
ncbi:MAG TPA: arginine deiminase [Chloroflexi bacterium]|nr:arginine deiminase [Chloroflexota bacterium]